ncbi:MAG: FG-GAP repeat protein [Planctomycetes bacterium]|nr:FG-GAP repeat protein [Planctomycetota bacterium]
MRYERSPAWLSLLLFGLGTSPTLAQTTTRTLAPQSAQFEGFNAALAPVGDYNSDGVPDLIASRYQFLIGGGAAEIFSGSNGTRLFSTATAGPLPPGTPSIVIFLAGASAAGLGDVNSDGIDDFIVGAPEVHPDFPDPGYAIVFAGGTGAALKVVGGTGFGNSQNRFGMGASGPGDINFDGVPDYLVLATNPYNVFAFSGANGQLLHTFQQFPGATQFGAAMASVGDLSGDGATEIVFGAPGTAIVGLGASAGAASVSSGSDGAVLRVILGTTVGARLGASAAALGDVSGDGIPDFALGAPSAGTGSVKIHSGAGAALLHSLPGAAVGSSFGASMAGVGDLDGDGSGDLLVGAPTEPGIGGGIGVLRWFSGSAHSLLFEKRGLFPASSDTGLGSRVSALGDIDSDGIPESAALGRVTHSSVIGSAHVYATRAGLSELGPGTPGCKGTEYLQPFPEPAIGTPLFVIRTTKAPNLSTGLALMADAGSAGGTDPFGLGILLHVDLLSATEVLSFDVPSNPQGIGLLAASIPNHAGLIGKTYFTQFLWLWQPTECTPSTYGLASSVGLKIIIQP